MSIRGARKCCPGCSPCDCSINGPNCSLGISLVPKDFTFQNCTNFFPPPTNPFPYHDKNIEISIQNCAFMVDLLGGRNGIGTVTVTNRYDPPVSGPGSGVGGTGFGCPGNGPAHRGGYVYQCISPPSTLCQDPWRTGVQYTWWSDLSATPLYPEYNELLIFEFHVKRVPTEEISAQQKCFALTWLSITWRAMTVVNGIFPVCLNRCVWTWCPKLPWTGDLCLVPAPGTSNCCFEGNPADSPYNCEPGPKRCPCPSVSYRFVNA